MDVEIPNLRCNIHIQVEVRTVHRHCVLRPDKEVLAICISLSSLPSLTLPLPHDAQGALPMVVGCWKWSISRMGSCTFFWGKDLCLDNDAVDVDGKRRTRHWLGCHGRAGGERVAGTMDEELKPLLVDM
jgi:hypothetical protein